MGLLQPATKGSYLKAGLLGFAGGGKTWTALLLAIGTRKLFGLEGQIAMFDTERGSDDIEGYVLEQTGKPLLVAKRRSLVDLMEVARECERGGISVLIVDSITHVWREVNDSYIKAKKSRGRSDRMEFQDWGRVKAEWSQWPDWFLNSSMHVIVCGRAGWEYETQENDEGKKEMVKAGIKMKAETEFGFEPGLVVEMQRDFATDRKGNLTNERGVINRAIVLKDRKRVLDGRSCEDPTFEFFRPHVEQLLGGTHVAVDTAGKTSFDIDNGADWMREKKQREINAEEIEAALHLVWEGQSSEAKGSRLKAMKEFWGSTSKTFIAEKMTSLLQREGLMKFYKANPDSFGDGPPAPDAELPKWMGGDQPDQTP